MRAKAVAPAKVNLTLHVTGQRDDGYHTLDSLVVFAEAGDPISVKLADGLSLTVSGPFATGIPRDNTNLVMRAATLLRRMRNVTAGAEITLEKQLPHAAGIGSGSSDAACVLSLLAELWNVDPLPPDLPEIMALGADVPVCMFAPQPMRMSGIGDKLSFTPALPNCAMVLVNPGISVPTPQIFAGLKQRNNAPMENPPEGADFRGFAAWLVTQRNDLSDTAMTHVPEIGRALAKLNSIPSVAWAGMSGSGATCVGLVSDMAAARQVARAVQVAEMGWWVTPAAVLR